MPVTTKKQLNKCKKCGTVYESVENATVYKNLQIQNFDSYNESWLVKNLRKLQQAFKEITDFTYIGIGCPKCNCPINRKLKITDTDGSIITIERNENKEGD